MPSHMRFQGLRVLDETTVEYEFLTDDAEIVRHRFTSTDPEDGIQIVSGDRDWHSAYSRVPGAYIAFEQRWSFELARLAWIAHRQEIPIGQALADLHSDALKGLADEWERKGHR